MISDGVLDGVRVLDLTSGFAGALCTMILGDNGAAVVHIVSSDPDDDHDDDRLAGTRQWRRSTKAHVANLSSDGDRAEWARLAREADVLVTTRGQQEMAALGLAAQDVLIDNPALVYCSIDGFGDHPRLRNLAPHEGVAVAAAGRMCDYGRTFGLGRPAFCAPPVASFGAAQAALQGILAALHIRQRSGRGQEVRTSLLRGLTAYDIKMWLYAQFPSEAPVLQDLPMIQYIPARTKDGKWIQFANWAPHLFWEQAEVLGLGHLRHDPRFAGLPLGQVGPPVLHDFWERVLVATKQRTADEWMTLLIRRGQAGGDLIRHAQDGMNHPQARFNGDVIDVDDANGRSEQIGPLVHMEERPGSVGIHNWGTTRQPRSSPVLARSEKCPRPGPLGDITILEAATMVATPLGPAFLSDLGARVIKIEPLGGDPGRMLGLMEQKMIQGKESIAINLKDPRGLDIVRRLVARADMFVHNFRPGVPERLGIDYPSLRACNPMLLYLYAGAYGVEGPYAKMPAYHPVAGAICGNAARQAGEGTLDDDQGLSIQELKARSLRIYRANEGHPDMATGLVVATALLLGLVGRDRFGVGQNMTTTMLTANAYLMSDDWIDYPGRPPRPQVSPDLLGTTALNRLYETADGWVFLAVHTQREWRSLCTLLGDESLATDDLFTNVEQRRRNDGELANRLASALLNRSADAWEEAAAATGLGCARADRMGFGEFQRVAAELGWAELSRTTESPGIGCHWRQAELVDMDDTGGPLGGSCLVGEHTASILAELGYDDVEVAQLVDTGTVGVA